MNYDTPFDQFSRQRIVSDILDSLRLGPKASFTVLDIGGYRGRTVDVLKKDQVIVTDLYDSDEPGYVQASGLALPFDDGEFDFAVSFDVLEHVADKDRLSFVEEALRVSKRGFLLCAPHKSAINVQAEELLNDLYGQIHGQPHRWLKEHIDNDLPDIDAIIKPLEKNYCMARIYSNDSFLWTLMQGALFLNEKYPQGAPELIKLNKFINEQLSYTSGAEPANSYRQITAIMHTDIDAMKISKTVTSDPVNDDQRQTVLKLYQLYQLLIVQRFDAEVTEIRSNLYKAESELNDVRNEIANIKSSKTWHLAQNISKVRHIRSR